MLKPDLPPQLSRFSPRLQYLRGWNLFHRHNPSAAEVVRSAVAAAAEKNDPETEADGLLLLVAAGENNRKLAEQALSVSRRHQLRFQEAVSLNEVGMVAIHEQRYADAIADFSSLATLSKNLQAHFLEVSALTNIGECYFSVGDMERARQALLKALPMLRASENSELRVGVNRELGGLYSLRQQNAEAISNFRDALEAAKSAGPFSRIYISSANDLAEALLQTHTLDEAEKYNNLAFAAMRDANSRTWDLVAPNELNRADLFAERGQLNEAQVSYRKVLGLLSKEPPNSIQWSAYARLAVVQERAGRQAEAKKNFENALHAIELNRSQQAGAQYQITFLSALIRFYQQYVDFLVRQNHPWDALPVADSSRASVLSSGLISSRGTARFRKACSQARARIEQHAAFLLVSAAGFLCLGRDAGRRRFSKAAGFVRRNRARCQKLFRLYSTRPPGHTRGGQRGGCAFVQQINCSTGQPPASVGACRYRSGRRFAWP